MDIDNQQDIIDVRDIIERFEDLDASADPDDREDRDELEKLLGELRGYGGNHQWEGDWYPVTLIRDSYFETYAQELADDIIEPSPSKASWPFNHIDWEAAADELRIYYATVDYNGVTYWYR
ncbi:hypothetical protein [Mycobacterium avium]|uniref:hypothetical protein n=1 Tax=Mycobacterium avium TaxID=1764 RepID=UPI000CE500C6|nr:hypothetical protein [Mycobacterium avium]